MKTWYAAHVVMAFHWKNREQQRFPVWENIVLVEADSAAEAFAKAERHGRDAEGDSDGSLLWAGQPAVLRFEGIRKLVECVDPESRPGDGTEISYTEWEAASLADLKRFAAGKPVPIQCNDRFRPRKAERLDATAKRPKKRAQLLFKALLHLHS